MSLTVEAILAFVASEYGGMDGFAAPAIMSTRRNPHLDHVCDEDCRNVFGKPGCSVLEHDVRHRDCETPGCVTERLHDVWYTANHDPQHGPRTLLGETACGVLNVWMD